MTGGVCRRCRECRPVSGAARTTTASGMARTTTATLYTIKQKHSSIHPSILFPTITIGDGSTVPVSCVGTTSLSSPRSPLLLREVLVAPALIQNLIFVRRFTIDNQVSVEFDPFGLSVKDLHSKAVIARFNSSGDLYTVHPAPPAPPHAMVTSFTTWHRRLGHPSRATQASL